MTDTTLELPEIGMEEAMDLAVPVVIETMSHEELAEIYVEMSGDDDDDEDGEDDDDDDEDGKQDRIDSVMSDMSHRELAVVYVENCDPESLSLILGRPVTGDDE